MVFVNEWFLIFELGFEGYMTCFGCIQVEGMKVCYCKSME